MKTLTDEQLKKIQKLEAQADALVEKESFDACISAVGLYIDADGLLQRYANDDTIENARPAPAFNSDNVTYNAWHMALMNKMSKAQAMLADPKLARK